MATVVGTFRYLVVDDSQFVQQAIPMVLGKIFDKHRYGWICDHAFSGDLGVEFWKTSRYDLTIMDYEMPGKNGVEATREILAIDRFALIVGFTGSEDEEIIAECKKAGMMQVFPKNVMKVRDYVESLIREGFNL